MARLRAVRALPPIFAALAASIACGAAEATPAAVSPGAGTTPSSTSTPASPAIPAPSVAIERLDASPECDGLLPDGAPPAPVSAVFAPGAGATCGGGVSDGTGHVALGAGLATGGSIFEAHAPDGAPLGRFTAVAIAPEPAGWHGLTVDPGPSALQPRVNDVVFAPDGAAIAVKTVSPDPATATAFRWSFAQDPLGGGGESVSSTLLAGNHWFRIDAHRTDAAGTPRASTTPVVSDFEPGAPAFLAMGIARGGGALVLWQRSGLVHLQWLGPDGAPVGTEGVDGTLAAVLGTFDLAAIRAADVALVALLDGSLALRVNGAWRRTYAPGAAPAPAPAWLVAHDGWTLRFTRGARGYALLPPAGGAATPCGQTIDVAAASGRLCGRVAIRIDPGACIAGAINQGWDGTVVAQDAAGACTYHWWTGLLAG